MLVFSIMLIVNVNVDFPVWTVLGLQVGATIHISIVSMPMQVLASDQYLVCVLSLVYWVYIYTTFGK